MDIENLEALLTRVQSGATNISEAMESLRSLPYENVGDFARIDNHRALRTGMAEVVFAPENRKSKWPKSSRD